MAIVGNNHNPQASPLPQKDQHPDRRHQAQAPPSLSPSLQQQQQQQSPSALKRLLSTPPPLKEMTPAQELANALTMLLPCALCWVYLTHMGSAGPASDPLALLVAVATTAHMPASVAYHFSCVLCRPSDVLKKMDFTLIHTASVAYSFATSASLAYAGANILWNLYALHVVWRGIGWRKTERARMVLISVALYTLPIALRGDLIVYSGAIASFGAAGGIYFFNKLLGGWDHAIFHLLLPAFQYNMLLAASNCYRDNVAHVDGLAAVWMGQW